MNATIENAIAEVNATIPETIETLEDKIFRLNANFTEDLYKEIQDAISAKNKVSKDEAIAKLLTIGATDMILMMTDFINNPFYKGEKIVPDNKNGGHKLGDSNFRINFPCLETAYLALNENATSLAKSPVYHGMTARFLHNLSLNKVSSIGDGKATKLTENGGKAVSAPVFSGEVTKNYRDVDFTTLTIKGLKDQLNALVDCLMPEGLDIHMVKADVHALLAASSSADKEMSFKIIDEEAMLNRVFKCIEIRMNDKAYSITSKAKCHKAV